TATRAAVNASRRRRRSIGPSLPDSEPLVQGLYAMPTGAEYCSGQAVVRKNELSDRPQGRARRSLLHLRRLRSSKRARLVGAVGSTAIGLLLVALAALHVRNAPMPFSQGKPTLL